MFCRHCGAQIAESAGFCTKCGQQVQKADVPSVVSAVDVTPAPPVGQASLTPAEQVTQGRSKPSAGLIVVLAVAGLLLGLAGAAALYFTGALEFLGMAPPVKTSSSDSAGKADREAPKDDSGTESEEGVLPDETISADESFAILEQHYYALWDLHAEIGIANADGTYGGTGFAYDVFNPEIGNPDAAVRAQLVSECQALADRVKVSRSELASAAVAAEYASQRDVLLGLYDLLDTRMQAMLGAATIAVDSPDEASWRPTLSPASVDSRKAFEAGYPGAAPTRL